MNVRLVAPLCSGLLAVLAVPVQASDIQHVYEGLSTSQYLEIMVATLVMLVASIGIFYLLGKRNSLRDHVNPVTRYLGMGFAIFCLILGAFFLIIDFIVLIEPYMETYAFAYLVLTFRYYFPEIVFGIITFGAAGLLLYLIGFYVMAFVLESTKMAKDTESYRIQATSEVDRDVSKGNVAYFKLAYRVISWDTGEPIPDEKIRLETKEGTLMMIKYTDSAGEVDFGKLRGRNEDYFAYAEGDRDRQEYRFVSIT